jgi:hypothetical protein
MPLFGTQWRAQDYIKTQISGHYLGGGGGFLSSNNTTTWVLKNKPLSTTENCDCREKKNWNFEVIVAVYFSLSHYGYCSKEAMYRAVGVTDSWRNFHLCTSHHFLHVVVSPPCRCPECGATCGKLLNLVAGPLLYCLWRTVTNVRAKPLIVLLGCE